LPEANVTRKILLTGRPGSGKTTLIKRIVNNVALPVGGFYTEVCFAGHYSQSKVIISLLLNSSSMWEGP
jgi:nucleoside-triphosphatase THEP1